MIIICMRMNVMKYVIDIIKALTIVSQYMTNVIITPMFMIYFIIGTINNPIMQTMETIT